MVGRRIMWNEWQQFSRSDLTDLIGCTRHYCNFLNKISENVKTGLNTVLYVLTVCTVHTRSGVRLLLLPMVK
jgi:hypothetical protein